jgi:hypothetical protein
MLSIRRRNQIEEDNQRRETIISGFTKEETIKEKNQTNRKYNQTNIEN